MKSLLLAVLTLVALTSAAPLNLTQEGDKWTWQLKAEYRLDYGVGGRGGGTGSKLLWKIDVKSAPLSDKQTCVRSVTNLFLTYGSSERCKQLTNGGPKPTDPAAAVAAKGPAEQQAAAAFDMSQLASGQAQVSCTSVLPQALAATISEQNAAQVTAKVGLQYTTSAKQSRSSSRKADVTMQLATQNGEPILRDVTSVEKPSTSQNVWSGWVLFGVLPTAYNIAKGDDGKWTVTLAVRGSFYRNVKVGSKDSYDSEEEAKKARDEAVKHMRKILHVIITGEAPTEQQKKKEQQPPAKKEQQPGKNKEQQNKEAKNKKEQPKKEQPVANKKEQQKKPAEQPAKKQQQGQAEAHDDNDVSEDDTEDDSDDDDETDF